jgi:aspartyl-tRNA(Asn)/glutamyl-tRNA(Gln) amidotransferase subunit A
MAEGKVSSEELVRECLDAIHRLQIGLNAFVYVAPEADLIAQARQLDTERRRGVVRSPLHGIPVSVKDVINVKGMPTTASSKVLAGHVAVEDATVVRLLREAGAIITGKTQTHEFALGVTTPQSHNPWDPECDPGGSSGGSAISVATGMSMLSVGTDTRASIRVPAALCGIVGYKPTYRLVSTRGVITLSWSMDHIGLQAQSVFDLPAFLGVVMKSDPQEPSAVDLSTRVDITQVLKKDARGLKIGVPIAALEGVDGEVLASFRACVEALHRTGNEVIETDLPTADDFRMANSVGLVLSRCEAAAFHTSFHADPSEYTTTVAAQLQEASSVLALDYLNAQRFRGEFMERMLALFDEYDALIMPTCPVPAPKIADSDSFLLILSRNCIPWSFTGAPAVSLPCGITRSRLPIGVQLVAAPFDDELLLSLSATLESAVSEIGRPI